MRLNLTRPGGLHRPDRPRPGLSQRGFTLIEVMVALAVVSIALAALSRAMGVTVSTHSAIDERVVATWVAQNELAKLQLQPDSRGEAKQQVRLLGREWTTELIQEDTLIADVKKITLTVTPLGQQTPSVTLVTVAGP